MHHSLCMTSPSGSSHTRILYLLLQLSCAHVEQCSSCRFTLRALQHAGLLRMLASAHATMQTRPNLFQARWPHNHLLCGLESAEACRPRSSTSWVGCQSTIRSLTQ